MRNVHNKMRLVQEHLEAMQRDVYGLEYRHWKNEVDALWRSVFEEISKMGDDPQQTTLETIRADWTLYLTHYASIQVQG
tara:strand:- start:78 stop:314 length:237 start_codon:yes stop_codon:yes gene_type:complete